MVIALLTDFGTRDHFVAAMKGTILSISLADTIVDITHETEPQNVREAAFTLAACYKDFPAGTIFVVVVDPGVGSDRRGIAAASGGYHFVAPDNGVLSFVLDDEAEAVELNQTEYFAERVSSTFHGRDVFAPVAAHLSKGVCLEEFGPAIHDPVVFKFPAPRIDGDGSIAGEIIHIDRFGNLITNLRNENLPPSFTIEVNGRGIERHCEYYGQVEQGEVFTIFGSTGFLEIAVNQGSANEVLAACVGDPLSLIDK